MRFLRGGVLDENNYDNVVYLLEIEARKCLHKTREGYKSFSKINVCKHVPEECNYKRLLLIENSMANKLCVED